MKISIALSLLILCIGAVLGWRENQCYEIERTSFDKLAAAATHAGITLDPTRVEDGKRGAKRERGRKNTEVDVGQFIAGYIAFTKEMETPEKEGGPTNEAMREKGLKITDSLMSLNATQLKQLIAEVRTNQDLKQDYKQELIRISITALAKDQPQAALVLFTESSDLLKESRSAQHAFSTSLANCAKQDPAAALEWVRANAAKFPDLVNDDAKRGLISGAATNDPRLAFQLIGELGLKDDDNTLRQITAAAKTPEERTATLAALREHLATLPEGEVRDKASTSVLQSLTQNAAREGFETGSKWIESAGLNAEQLVEIWDSTFSLKLEESGKWVEWLGAKEPGKKTHDGIGDIVRYWTEKDYQAAGKWLTTTPAGPTKDISIRSYAEAVAKYEPESAAQWALTLPPGKDRDETLKRIYEKWPENDEAAKQAFKKLHGIN